MGRYLATASIGKERRAERGDDSRRGDGRHCCFSRDVSTLHRRRGSTDEVHGATCAVVGVQSLPLSWERWAQVKHFSVFHRCDGNARKASRSLSLTFQRL